MGYIHTKLGEYIDRRIKAEEADPIEREFVINRIVHDARPIFYQLHNGKNNSTLKNILRFLSFYGSVYPGRIKRIKSKYQKILQSKDEE